MTGIIDYQQYEKYKKIATFIEPAIPSNIINTYKKYIDGKPAGDYIHKNYIEPIKPNDTGMIEPINLIDIIATCVYIALSKENIDEAIRTYKEIRRVNKRNWFQSIKEEMTNSMKPKNPQLLRQYAENLYHMQNMDRGMLTTQTIDAIMQEVFFKIEAWKTDTSAPITDFIFVSEKTTKTLSNAFVNDITYFSLVDILQNYGGSLDGMITKLPNLMEHPIFSYRSTALEFETELLQNELSFFQSYQVENDDNETVSDITIKYNPDVKLPAITPKDNVSNIMSKYHIDLKQKDLDMKDREIMTQLFNLISLETMTNPIIMVNLRDFTRKIFNIKVPKQKHYEDIGQRLEKLKNFDYTISIKDKNSNETIAQSSVGLLNYVYINYEENFFQFTPSDQLLKTFVQHRYSMLLSSEYKTIESAQTKSILVLLQQERLTEFNNNSDTKILTLKYFRSHLKLIKMTNAALIKELTKHFSVLKKEKIVVKDFEFITKNSAVKITFYPLSERELIAYDFNGPAIETDTTEIEAAYKEISD